MSSHITENIVVTKTNSQNEIAPNLNNSKQGNHNHGQLHIFQNDKAELMELNISDALITQW